MNTLFLIFLSIVNVFTPENKYTNRNFGYSVSIPNNASRDSIHEELNLEHVHVKKHQIRFKSETATPNGSGFVVYAVTSSVFTPTQYSRLSTFYSICRNSIIAQVDSTSGHIVSRDVVELPDKLEIIYRVEFPNEFIIGYWKLVFYKNKVYYLQYETPIELFSDSDKNSFFKSLQIDNDTELEDKQFASFLAQVNENVDKLNDEYERKYHFYNQSQINTSFSNPENLVKQCDSLISIDPTNTKAYATRGLAKRWLNKNIEALNDFNYCLKINDNDSFSLVNRAFSCATLQRNDEAICDFSKAIRLYFMNPQIYLLRGNTYYNNQQFREAIADLDIAINRSYYIEEAYFLRGMSNAQLKNITKARHDLRMLDYGENKLSEWYITLLNGLICAQTYQFDSAKVYLKHSFNYNNDNTAAILLLCNVCFEQRKYQEALMYCNKIINLYPNNYKYYFERGLIYYELKDFELCIANYSKAIGLNKANEQIFFFRAQTYKDLHKFPEALADYNAAIAINNKNAEMYYRRGCLKVVMRDKDGACQDFSIAKKLGWKGTEVMTKGYCQ